MGLLVVYPTIYGFSRKAWTVYTEEKECWVKIYVFFGEVCTPPVPIFLLPPWTTTIIIVTAIFFTVSIREHRLDVASDGDRS